MVWITATEALALLQVLPQTLYANVSRGKVRARPDECDPPSLGQPLPDLHAQAASVLATVTAALTGQPPATRALPQTEPATIGARLARAWHCELPSIDFALSLLAHTCRLPPDAPLILFALGRCAGWLAHALEQVETGQLIRPRARYVGPTTAPSAGIY